MAWRKNLLKTDGVEDKNWKMVANFWIPCSVVVCCWMLCADGVSVTGSITLIGDVPGGNVGFTKSKRVVSVCAQTPKKKLFRI